MEREGGRELGLEEGRGEYGRACRGGRRRSWGGCLGRRGGVGHLPRLPLVCELCVCVVVVGLV